MMKPWSRENEAVRRSRNPHARARLFCIPHSGAGASTFTDWIPHLPSSLELCAIQLPGREDRVTDPLPSTLAELVATLVRTLASYDDLPFLLFGHSSGAIVAYEVAREMRRHGTGPRSVIVSACRAPHLPPERRSLHEMSDAELVAELRSLEGMPEEALQSAELMQVLLPRIRADVALTADISARSSIDIPLVAMCGDADRFVEQLAMRAWSAYTTAGFHLHMMEGDHFYVTKRAREVVKAVVDQTLDVLGTRAVAP
jgi:medium-chain acyl-[acyl-carrier-protein] hydrolase